MDSHSQDDRDLQNLLSQIPHVAQGGSPTSQPDASADRQAARAHSPSMEPFSSRFIKSVVEAVRDNRRIARKLPLGGRVLIDRSLPYLVLFRQTTDVDDRQSPRLVTAQASHLVIPSHRRLHAHAAELVQQIVRAIHERFGKCLLIEVWASQQKPAHEQTSRCVLQPGFDLYVPERSRSEPAFDTLQADLSRIRLDRNARIARHPGPPHPPHLPPLLNDPWAQRLHAARIGLAVEPVYRDWESGTPYPLVFQRLRKQFSAAIKQTCFDYITSQTSLKLPHPHALGSGTLDPATRICDRRLAQVADATDVLLDVTPTNEHTAWEAFQASRHQREPQMHYRPLPLDPAVLKRNLHRIPIEQMDDPALADLFRERQVELDMQLNLLNDRNTDRFVLESEQIYGRPDTSLLQLAVTILDRLPPGEPDFGGDGQIDARTFAQRAREVVNQYHRQSNLFQGSVHIRDDVSTLIVSHGCLLIGEHMVTRKARLDAFVHHEISTHMLCYYNGRQQPLKQLHTGLAGYETLQEGLGILIEYLVGGMNRKRWRVLAARVLAVDRMLQGDSFIDTFHRLHEGCEIDAHTAFRTTMRVYRSGGFTKDIIYLQGLRDLLAHLGNGGELESLYLGRFALHHLTTIQELRWRGIIQDGWLLPTPLSSDEARQRLHKVRTGVSVLDLACELETD